MAFTPEYLALIAFGILAWSAWMIVAIFSGYGARITKSFLGGGLLMTAVGGLLMNYI